MNLSSFIMNSWTRLLVVLAALVSLIVFVAIPLQKKITLENDEVQKTYVNMDNEQKRISILPDFRAKYRKISDDKGKMGSVLSEDRVVEYIKDLENIARETGGMITVKQGKDLETIRNTAPKKEVDAAGNIDLAISDQNRIVDHLPNGKTLGLIVVFSGRYRDAVEFVHKVETAPYFVDIVSLDFRPGDVPVVDRGNLFVSPTTSSSVVSTDFDSKPSVAVQAVIELVLYLE